MKTKDPLFKNIANTITLLGFFSTIWLAVVIIAYPEKLWLIIFLAGFTGLTDLIDGRIARDLNITSDIGSALDRLRDKGFICSALILLTWQSRFFLNSVSFLPVVITISLISMIVVFEILLLISGLIGIIKRMDINAGKAGKAKMFLEFLAVIFWLLFAAYEKYWGIKISNLSIYFIDFILAVALILAFISLRGYYRRYYKDVFESSAQK